MEKGFNLDRDFFCENEIVINLILINLLLIAFIQIQMHFVPFASIRQNIFFMVTPCG